MSSNRTRPRAGLRSLLWNNDTYFVTEKISATESITVLLDDMKKKRNLNIFMIENGDGALEQAREADIRPEAPQYLTRDRDRIYGNIVTRRLRAMGVV